jgi:hypothetical protein
VEALFGAARSGDVATVRQLLDGGLDVNTKGRYGTTALFAAADKGHLPVVDLLLARGVDVNAVDTFYKASALTWAVNHDHAEIARRLVEKGAAEPESALELAVKVTDEALARAVLARGPLRAPERLVALKGARDAGATAIVALLEGSAPKAEPEVPMTAEKLAPLTGTYTGEGDARVVVEVAEGRLTARLAKGDAVALLPIGDNRFRAPERPEFWMEFGGRGGTIEWAATQEGAQRSFHRRAAAASESPAVAAASEPPLTLPAPTRASAAPWPAFRGANASGNGDGQGAPSTWDVAKGTNVLFKTALPGMGLSSPIVWGDRVYLTTAVSAKGEATFRTGLYGDVEPVPEEGPQAWRLVCVDRTTGRVLWDKVAHEGMPRVKRHTKSTYANPTPLPTAATWSPSSARKACTPSTWTAGCSGRRTSVSWTAAGSTTRRTSGASAARPSSTATG